VILLAILALGLVVSLLTGGRIERLANVHFRYSYLILIALWVQILIFSRWWQSTIGHPVVSSGLYIASMLLLAITCWLNRHVPGIVLLGIGLLLNSAVIVANGGYMPTSLQALRTAGIIAPDATLDAARATNSSLIDENTLLWFLGDIMAIPSRIPLANIFSIGDVVIGLGAIRFLFANMRGASPAEPNDSPTTPSPATDEPVSTAKQE